MTAFFKRHAWMVFLGGLAAIFAIGVALAFVGDSRSSSGDDVWSDVSKAGVQVALLTVAGAVVTAAFKYIDEHRARDEQRRQVFREVLAAYNQVKAVRRNLRAIGLLQISPSQEIVAQQAKEVRIQMTALSEAQLRFEAIARELEESGLFKDLGSIIVQIRTAEKYLGECVLRRWEAHGGEVWEGADGSAFAHLELERFIGDKKRFPEFEIHVSTQLDHMAKTLHDQLFGISPSGKKR